MKSEGKNNPSSFNPESVGQKGEDYLFGMPPAEHPAVQVFGLPWDLSSSFRRGSAKSPKAIQELSDQIDLYDPNFPGAWKAGFALKHLDDHDFWPDQNQIHSLRDKLSAHREQLEGGGAGNEKTQQEINQITHQIHLRLKDLTTSCLEADQIPAILGGDHSCPLGAYQAALGKYPDLAIIQIDAHADLRPAYEGLEHSHASIMHNALESGLSQLKIVGLREASPAELKRCKEDERISSLEDYEIANALSEGKTWAEIIHPLINNLPEHIWISLDIDGLDVSLSQHTGTPVPGGLSWHQLQYLFSQLAARHKIIGFDLCEIRALDLDLQSEGKVESWDAILGARLLFRLCSLAYGSQQK
jgi:agmatinase